MEHEDQNIRNKIRDWENSGRVYNSDQLWGSLASYPVQRTRRPAAFYFAAAALVLSGALIIYSLGETQRKAIELRMMEIELSLKQAESIPQQAMMVDVQEVPCPVTEKPTRQRVLRTTRSPIIQQASLAKEATAEPEPVATPLPIKVEVMPAESLPAQEQTTAVPRVILGSPIVDGPPSTSVKNRMSLRLFKSDPDQAEIPKAGAPVVTLASINN